MKRLTSRILPARQAYPKSPPTFKLGILGIIALSSELPALAFTADGHGTTVGKSERLRDLTAKLGASVFDIKRPGRRELPIDTLGGQKLKLKQTRYPLR